MRRLLLVSFLVSGPVWAGAGATGAEDYPQVRVQVGGREALLLNKGSRILGEYYAPSDRWTRLHVESSGARDFGDIDGDGRLDEVDVTGVYLGHGDGHLGIRTVEFLMNSDMGIACGDLNGDGRDDVVLGTRGIRAYLANPDGTLTFWRDLELFYEAGGIPPVLELVDLDADGDLDVLGASANGPLLAYNLGAGRFREWKDTPIRFTNRMTICDLNGDGLKDLVTTGGIPWYLKPPLTYQIAVFVYLGAGRESLADERILPIPGLDSPFDSEWQGAAVGDVDRDGKDDILSSGVPGVLNRFRGRGDGTFEEPSAMPLPTGDQPKAMLLEDLDLDGHLDLLVGYRGWSSHVYWGLPEGFVDFQSPSDAEAYAPGRFEVVRRFHRTFLRGDADDDGAVGLPDAVAIVEQLFAGRETACGDASDADDSGRVNILDPVYLLRHLFMGGPPPTYPWPERGGDPTKDRSLELPGDIFGDLGCSPETFRSRDFEPCEPLRDGSMDHCQNPIRQFLDVRIPQ